MRITVYSLHGSVDHHGRRRRAAFLDGSFLSADVSPSSNLSPLMAYFQRALWEREEFVGEREWEREGKDYTSMQHVREKGRRGWKRKRERERKLVWVEAWNEQSGLDLSTWRSHKMRRSPFRYINVMISKITRRWWSILLSLTALSMSSDRTFKFFFQYQLATSQYWMGKLFTVHYRSRVLSINAETLEMFSEKKLWFEPGAAGFGSNYFYHCAMLPPRILKFISLFNLVVKEAINCFPVELLRLFYYLNFVTMIVHTFVITTIWDKW